MNRTEFAARCGLGYRAPDCHAAAGSRRSCEIERHYPLIMEACERLRDQTRGAIQFVLAAAPALRRSFLLRHARPGVSVTRVEGATYDALGAADCAIVASGTATVEAALLGTPMVVVYRVSPTSAFVLKRMVRSPFIAMVNLIAGRRVVPELIQDQFTSEAVVEEVRKLLGSPAARDEMNAGLAEVRTKLGPAARSKRAAQTFSRGCCKLR